MKYLPELKIRPNRKFVFVHKAYWSSAVHLYSRLPFLNRKFPMVDNCRIHFFANAGNLADKLLSGM